MADSNRPLTPPRQPLVDAGAALEASFAFAVLVFAGCIARLVGWDGQIYAATSTTWWPFYLNTWPPSTIWTPRIFASLAALVAVWWAVRRWTRDQSRARWLDLAILCAAVYALHFALGVQRWGISDSLAHTFVRDGLEYWGDTPLVAKYGVGGFLRAFPDFKETLSQHGSTHPPGLTLLLHGVRMLGFKEMRPAELACTFFAALTALPLWGAARRLTDEATARFCVPLMILACSVSAFALLAMDSATMFVAALALYGLARALDGELAGGVLWGLTFAAATLCTFTVALSALTFGAIIAARLVDRSRPRPPRLWIALACGPAAFVLFYGALIAAFGYRPLHVFQACLATFRASHNVLQPRGRRLIGNPIAFLGSLGLPLMGLSGHALGGALARVRRAVELPTVLLVLGALAPPALCIATGTPRGEVEHIFLPFVPAIVLGSAAAARRWYGRGFRWLRDFAVPLVIIQSILVEIFADTFW
ncbi:MAG: hypothetical protein JWM53_1661 [bacterium]|nr:hypothetical protein [bacterium]